MNVYDFDKTIYDGDSTTHFYFYCLKKYPAIIKYLPGTAWAFFLYIIGIYTKTRFKEKMYSFLKAVPDVTAEVKSFWDGHIGGIKPFYLKHQSDDDIIISASPEFLLIYICKKLGIKHLLASRVDPETGKYTGENCHGVEKVKRLAGYMPDFEIDEFYSDSLSDMPLMKLAKQGYMVTGHKTVRIEDYKRPPMKRFADTFFARDFLSFAFIGVINTLNNFIISYLVSSFFNPNIAFTIGYLASLSIAYILNSKITFRQSLDFGRYIKFCLSYMPNFAIQHIIVFIIYNLLNLHKALAFGLAAVIGVPVTFIIMKIFTFKKKNI